MATNQIKKEYSKVIHWLLIVLMVFLGLLSISTLVDIQNKTKESRYIGQEVESKNNITVSDTGEIYTKPDLAVVVLSTLTEAKTVEQAVSQNTQKMNKIIEEVKSLDIKEEDLKTLDFNVSPRYEYPEGGLYRSGQRALVGYEVRQSLQVKIREMDKISSVLDKGTSAGANQVGNLNFIVDNQEEIKEQARAEAIKKAKEKAENIASQLGVDLVRIIDFQENSSMPYYDFMEKSAIGVGGGGPQIETGQNKISVTVNITYEIN